MPMRKRSLARQLDLDMDEYVDFRHLIDEMVDSGAVSQLKRGKYGLPRTAGKGNTAKGKKGRRAKGGDAESIEGGKGLPKNSVVGRMDIKRGGFGFLLSEPPGNDLYIGAEDLGGALSGDLVAVVPKHRPQGRNPRHLRGQRKTNARVVRILERARTLIVGTFFTRPPLPYDHPGMDKRRGYIVPDTRGLFGEIEVLEADRSEAREGDKVAVELVESEERNRSSRSPSGKIVKIFGEAGEAEAELEAIIQTFDLRTEFPEEVMKQAEGISTEIPKSELDLRIDYTSPLTFTIDPEDAKDHDDAVALRALSGGRTELLVHIADVSHYVTEGSPIDVEARERGTSVYLPGRVIPMLPEKLSNGICSLKEGELRLTRTARITFSKTMSPESVAFERSYIRSAAFLNYDQVRKAVDEEDPGQLPSLEIYETLCEMKAFAAKLRKKRLSAGSVDLDLPDVKLVLNDQGEIESYQKEASHWAHQLIEDMMLAANRAVAEYLVQHEILGLFRVHEEPEPTDLERFAKFAAEFGLKMKKPYDREAIISVLERVKDKEYRHTIHLALLTSLKQAQYSAECRPHFALNFLHYLHFTSPIRRYPDLVVHRAMAERFPPGEAALPVSGKRRKGAAHTPEYHQGLGQLRGLAMHCCLKERNAEGAEREVKKFRQIQFLRNNQAASHPGVITGVRDFGLFVELQDCYVEGLVRIEDLRDDYYHYYAEQHLLQGRKKRRSFQLGDQVTVRVAKIDTGQKKVTLLIV